MILICRSQRGKYCGKYYRFTAAHTKKADRNRGFRRTEGCKGNIVGRSCAHFELMEKRYLDLENQIKREIEIPNEKYAVSMTVITQKDYDPINGTLYPVVPALLQEDKEQEKQEAMPCIIYFAGSYQKKAEFEKAADFQGVDDSGKSYTVRVRKAKCYQQALSELYQVFVYNKICWTTVNTGYLDRFYEIDTDGETDGNGLKIDFGSYEEDIKNDMLLLWNIEKFTFQCRKFMVPCMDEKYYEHELDLKNYDLDSGYMLGINEDVLKVRHEKDKIIMTSLKESFRDWEAYRFIEKTDTSSHGYTCEMLSNSRKSSFFKITENGRKVPLAAGQSCFGWYRALNIMFM